jgi:hypothetical protein
MHLVRSKKQQNETLMYELITCKQEVWSVQGIFSAP